MSSIWQYVSGALMASLVLLSVYSYTRIGGLKLGLSEVRQELLLATFNGKQCSASLKHQNNVIEEVKIDYESRLAELKAWEDKPAEIRYNTIYKYIDREVIKNEDSCENTKAVISGVRSINYDKL